MLPVDVMAGVVGDGPIVAVNLQRDRLGNRPVELLTPPVGRSGMLDFSAGPGLVEPAYHYAVETPAQSRTAV